MTLTLKSLFTLLMIPVYACVSLVSFCAGGILKALMWVHEHGIEVCFLYLFVMVIASASIYAIIKNSSDIWEFLVMLLALLL